MDSAKYIGLDVHKESISIAVLNAAGKIVMECVIETKASTILQFFRGLRGDLHVTFEEGTSAAWLYDLIQPHVAQIVVCDDHIATRFASRTQRKARCIQRQTRIPSGQPPRDSGKRRGGSEMVRNEAKPAFSAKGPLPEPPKPGEPPLPPPVPKPPPSPDPSPADPGLPRPTRLAHGGACCVIPGCRLCERFVHSIRPLTQHRKVYPQLNRIGPEKRDSR